MKEWFLANWGNILVIALLSLAVFGIVFAHFRAKRKGKSTCAHGCAGCAMQGICHGKKNDNA